MHYARVHDLGGDCKEERDSEGQPNLPSPALGMLWWNSFGSQVPQTAFYNPAKSLFVDHPSRVPGAGKQVVIQSEQPEHPTCVASHSQSESEGVLMGTTRLQSMPIQSGCDGANGEKSRQCQSTNPIITSTPIEYLAPHAQLEFGPPIARAAYPYADPYFGSIMAAYGAQAMINPHILGVQKARMPLQLDMTEEPVYVNAKQYHGILRRRQCRAKQESENKLIKNRKPYLHESRHRHAMKRARGCGGRFLNTKKMEESKANAANGITSAEPPVQAGSSSGSEVLQSESGNVNSVQELHGASAMSGSEVTSISESSENGVAEEGGSEQSGVILSGGSQQRVVVIQ
ncbi:hypothetical protein SUGI_0519930 [Cryptomeria japonica]|nr:hypothetical protein SUGI_0519930 [Cryptomeria japonica]